MIVVHGSTIDDDVRRPRFTAEAETEPPDGRREWSPGHDKIGSMAASLARWKFCRIKILAKADRGRLQESAAATKWRPAMAAKEFEMRLGISAPMTGLTLDERSRAMKLDERLRRSCRRDCPNRQCFP